MYDSCSSKVEVPEDCSANSWVSCTPGEDPE